MHAQSVKNSQTVSITSKLSHIYQAHSYRIAVFSRFLAAILGGYTFTAVFTSLLSITLPLKKSDAVLLSVSLTILIYSCVFIWVFAVKSLIRIWITILLTTAGLALLLSVLKGWL
ncbi:MULTISPECIES: hypothetical protein [Pseudoalteromonas]|uniref:Iron transporter n=1 Tax=Pseudoalteromonas haloplanktis TaxID=228 RepID=A0ABU1B6R4_PSEHA|nr:MULTISPECIES: hypothetical protein [Pseudoalteromonas]MCF6146306.1 hypothetical protein [Pseudoalteromonas mariniglutinosa NCIMB 1770]MDQ9090259.1 hypothetical protein [Pseudoalteromonas haloplanktis]TMN71722.1 hypothetical protein CWB85_09860 [Pseudoalteromonas sp. S1727]